MNILEHPIYKDIYDLCVEIEKLPASEQQTKVVTMASALEQPVSKLLDEIKRLKTDLLNVRVTPKEGERVLRTCDYAGNGMHSQGMPM